MIRRIREALSLERLIFGAGVGIGAGLFLRGMYQTTIGTYSATEGAYYALLGAAVIGASTVISTSTYVINRKRKSGCS